MTYEEAAKSDNPAAVYCASKTLAEHAAWDFVEKEKVSAALLPTLPFATLILVITLDQVRN